jgi:hypothetical protein
MKSAPTKDIATKKESALTKDTSIKENLSKDTDKDDVDL